MIVFDSTMLLLTIRPTANAPVDEKTGKPVEYVEERITGLLKTLEKQKNKIIIPTPALSEVLTDAGKGMIPLIEKIQKNSTFSVIPFDTLAAIELAAMTYDAKKKGDKKSGSNETWAKIKFDRQIIAIAKVHNATAIYSDDENLTKFANDANISVVRLVDIPIPEDARQISFIRNKKDEESPEKLYRDIDLDDWDISREDPKETLNDERKESEETIEADNGQTEETAEEQN